MASGTAAPDYHSTLVASTVDTVTLPAGYNQWLLTTDGSARVDYTTDGSTPAVAGTATGRTIVATAGEGGRDVFLVNSATGGSLKLISAATPAYNVEPYMPGD